METARTTAPERAGKVCRICQKELSELEYGHLIRTHISQIPEEERASEEAYLKRLALCDVCRWQRNEMCRMCGCFVRVKASRKTAACPLDPPLWERIPLSASED